MTPNPTPPTPFLKRIKIRNFKSIAYCDVELGPLTILVGRNGSGKSNFLDAIRFVGEILRGDLAKAIDDRGGWDGVIYQPNDMTATLTMQLTLAIHPDLEADYEFEIASEPEHAGYVVRRERLQFHSSKVAAIDGFAWDGQTLRSYSSAPNFASDMQLFGVNEPVLKRAEYLSREFFDVFENLKSIRALNMNHLDFKEMRRPQNRSKVHLIDESGNRLAEVAYRIQENDPWFWERITGYLRAMTPMLRRVKAELIGDEKYVHLKFIESIAERSDDSSIPNVERALTAASMSDGTLRALATLIAINPIPNHPLAAHYNPVRLVGVEEPEGSLHPAAAGILMDALREAAGSKQIIVVTQSDDLLDRYDPETDRLLIAEMRDGATDIGPPNPASREAIQEHLATPGELLRMDQFRPDWEDIERQIAESMPQPVEVEQ
jgi:predicted ATPase